MMVKRKGMGKGKGKGYENLLPQDPRIHKDSGKGIKQPQKIPNNIRQRSGSNGGDKTNDEEKDFIETSSSDTYNWVKENTDSKIESMESGYNREQRLIMDDGTEWAYYNSYEDAELDAIESLEELFDGDTSSIGENLIEQFAYISEFDKEQIATDEARARWEDESDQEIIDERERQGGNATLTEIEEIQDEIVVNENVLEEGLSVDNANKRQDKIDKLETKKEELVEELREELIDQEENQVRLSLDADFIDYLVNEVGAYSKEDLLDVSFVQLDTHEVAKYVVEQDGLLSLAGYDGNWEDHRDFGVLIRTD